MICCWKDKTKSYNAQVNKCDSYSIVFLIFFNNNSFLFLDVIGLLCGMPPIQQRTIMKDSMNPRNKDIQEIKLLLLE
jgi:hypothetical protein